MVSVYKAQEWSLSQPLFDSPESLLEPLPLEMTSDEYSKWNMTFKGNIRFISQDGDATVSLQSLKAAGRYKKLWKIHEKFNGHVSIDLLMAECHFLMNDTLGACRLAKQARRTLQQRGQQDVVLDVAVEMLSILADSEMDVDDEDDDPAVQVIKYSRPPNWVPCSQPSNLVRLLLKWAKLQEQGDGAKQFARYASVSTNELEGVFLLDGDSSLRLARCGLYANSIEGISARSRHKNPEKIVSIIKNTQQCYSFMADVISGEKVMDNGLLKTIHYHLLQDDNIETSFDEYEELAAHMIPMGEYRGVPCCASHEETAGYITDFCPPRQIQAEMEWFFGQVQAILSDSDLDPYYACAWIQHSYLRIHPFGDGNGRLGRLISSIPLLRTGLPPVYVARESKREYFAALKVADDTGEIDDLSTFLQDETFRAMDSLLQYDASQPFMGICRTKNRHKKRIQAAVSKQRQS